MAKKEVRRITKEEYDKDVAFLRGADTVNYEEPTDTERNIMRRILADRYLSLRGGNVLVMNEPDHRIYSAFSDTVDAAEKRVDRYLLNHHLWEAQEAYNALSDSSKSRIEKLRPVQYALEDLFQDRLCFQDQGEDVSSIDSKIDGLVDSAKKVDSDAVRILAYYCGLRNELACYYDNSVKKIKLY